MVRRVHTARPAPEPALPLKPALKAKGRRHNGFCPLPVSDAPVTAEDSGKSRTWFPNVTNLFKGAYQDLREFGKEASTFGQGIMGMAVQELTEVGREVFSDLKETTMELQEISKDAQEQSRLYSRDLPDVIRNLLPPSVDCSAVCGNVSDEQLELNVPCAEEHLGVWEEPSVQAAVTFQTSPRPRRSLSGTSAYADFAKAAGPCQNGNREAAATSHQKEPHDSVFVNQLAAETAVSQTPLHHDGARRKTTIEITTVDKRWWAQRGTLSSSQSSSTSAGGSPALSARS
jgi:hypothetical protein